MVNYNYGKLQLEKIGKIKIVIDRKFEGKLMSVTISKDSCGDFFASILVETVIQALPKTGRAVGIDVGLKSLITTSDGRREKVRHQLAKSYRKTARRREWLLHNISKHLVESYDVISVEDLNISGMLKNHKLAKAISDASWSELIRQLEYKSMFYGKELVKINRWFPSSKTCNSCGLIKDDLELSDRIFNCECGYSNDRDLNAALNIKAVGVTTAQQTAMGCKTYLGEQSLKQAIPNDLLRFL